MKITEYPAITELSLDNITLVDGNAGTKKITIGDLILGGLALTSPYNKRSVFRGKNLGTSVSLEQKAAIQDGSFKGLWVGDYWVINGVNWRIADIDYWYNRGDTKFATHHLVIVPDTALSQAAMNASSVTTGGYVSSQMKTTNLATAKSAAQAAFPDMVKTHREYLINAVTSGYPSAGAWADSDVDLMNEIMVYGSYIYTAAGNGTVDVKRYTNSNQQLAMFRLCPEMLISGNGFWLRDVVSAAQFARVDSYGGATSTNAANSFGVRPAFAIG